MTEEAAELSNRKAEVLVDLLVERPLVTIIPKRNVVLSP